MWGEVKPSSLVFSVGSLKILKELGQPWTSIPWGFCVRWEPPSVAVGLQSILTQLWSLKMPSQWAPCLAEALRWTCSRLSWTHLRMLPAPISWCSQHRPPSKWLPPTTPMKTGLAPTMVSGRCSSRQEWVWSAGCCVIVTMERRCKV